MKIVFHPNAWQEYLFWQTENRKILRKTDHLIKEIIRTPDVGIGKPEPLKSDLSGFWSKRIDQEHRPVYQIKQNELHILVCRHHY